MFEMILQTNTEFIRGICFDVKQHEKFEKLSDSKAAVKLTNVTIDHSRPEDCLVIGSGSKSEETTAEFDIGTVKDESSCAGVRELVPGQSVSIVAKVISCSGPKIQDT